VALSCRFDGRTFRGGNNPLSWVGHSSGLPIGSGAAAAPPARVRVPECRFLPNGNFRHTSRACAGARPRRGDGRPDGGAAPRRPRRDPPGRSSWSKASGGAGRVRHGSGRGIPIRGNQGIPIRGPDPRAAPGIENASSRKCGRSRAGVKTGFCSRVPGARVRCFPGRPGSSSGPLRGVSKPVKFAGGVRLQGGSDPRTWINPAGRGRAGDSVRFGMRRYSSVGRGAPRRPPPGGRRHVARDGSLWHGPGARRVSRSIGSGREAGRSGRNAIRAGAPGSVAAVRLPAAFPGRDLFPPRRFRCKPGRGVTAIRHTVAQYRAMSRDVAPRPDRNLSRDGSQWLTMARCAGRRICDILRVGAVWFVSGRFAMVHLVPGARRAGRLLFRVLCRRAGVLPGHRFQAGRHRSPGSCQASGLKAM